MSHHKEGVTSRAAAAAAVLSRKAVLERAGDLQGTYTYEIWSPPEHLRAEFIALRDFVHKQRGLIRRWWEGPKVWDAETAMLRMPSVLRERGVFSNLVVTQGKNDLLDKYLSGSAYTAAWYLGLIGNSGYSAIAAGDTAASHAGWTETSAYSQSNRPTAAFSAAASGAKALSSPAAFSINTNATVVKGAAMFSNSAKGGTTGLLLSAGLFTGGDKTLDNGDTLNVSWSLSV